MADYNEYEHAGVTHKPGGSGNVLTRGVSNLMGTLFFMVILCAWGIAILVLVYGPEKTRIILTDLKGQFVGTVNELTADSRGRGVFGKAPSVQKQSWSGTEILWAFAGVLFFVFCAMLLYVGNKKDQELSPTLKSFRDLFYGPRGSDPETMTGWRRRLGRINVKDVATRVLGDKRRETITSAVDKAKDALTRQVEELKKMTDVTPDELPEPIKKSFKTKVSSAFSGYKSKLSSATGSMKRWMLREERGRGPEEEDPKEWEKSAWDRDGNFFIREGELIETPLGIDRIRVLGWVPYFEKMKGRGVDVFEMRETVLAAMNRGASLARKKPTIKAPQIFPFITDFFYDREANAIIAKGHRLFKGPAGKYKVTYLYGALKNPDSGVIYLVKLTTARPPNNMLKVLLSDTADGRNMVRELFGKQMRRLEDRGVEKATGYVLDLDHAIDNHEAKARKKITNNNENAK